MDCHGHFAFGAPPNPANPYLGDVVPETLAVGVHYSKPIPVGAWHVGYSFVFTAEGVGGAAGVVVDVLAGNRSNDDADVLPYDLNVTSPAGLSSVADAVEEVAVLTGEAPFNYIQLKITVSTVPVLFSAIGAAR